MEIHLADSVKVLVVFQALKDFRINLGREVKVNHHLEIYSKNLRSSLVVNKEDNKEVLKGQHKEVKIL